MLASREKNSSFDPVGVDPEYNLGSHKLQLESCFLRTKTMVALVYLSTNCLNYIFVFFR